MGTGELTLAGNLAMDQPPIQGGGGGGGGSGRNTLNATETVMSSCACDMDTWLDAGFLSSQRPRYAPLAV